MTAPTLPAGTGRTAQLTAALARTPMNMNRKRRPLETYKPSGQVSWPTILVEGPEGTGKSHLLAEFTADDRVGRSFWFEIGEVSAHEYGAVGDYEIVKLDGTWEDLLDQVLNVAEIAEAAHAAGEPPVVAVVDTVTPVWDNCAGWANLRAARDRRNQNSNGGDTDPWDVNVGPLGWANARERWYQFLRPLRIAPMIVILSAKAADTVAIDDSGKPIKNKTEYKIRTQKDLPYDVNAIVRLSPDRPPTITKCRSPKWRLRPGVDEPRAVRDLTLGRLIFDGMGFDPAKTQAPVQIDLDATLASEQPTPAEKAEPNAQDPWNTKTETNGREPAVATA